jgi:hypothetical protein
MVNAFIGVEKSAEFFEGGGNLLLHGLIKWGEARRIKIDHMALLKKNDSGQIPGSSLCWMRWHRA